MHKSVLSLSVAAALTVPGLASAQTPVVPTLDKVLEASGIAVTGYVDAGYTYANRNIEGTNFSTRVFDTQNNSFLLRQVGMQIAKQPKEGFGALVNVTAGKDAQAIHAAPEQTATPSTTSMFDITQGFLSYADGPWHVMAGKYVTLHSSEVIWSPGNANISRSTLFGSVPYTHTGVRAHYEIPDTATLFFGVNNGWDQLVDANKGKTLELGAMATPIKPLMVMLSLMGGKEPGTVANVSGRRDSLNFVTTYSVMEPLSVGFEYLRVSQKDALIDDPATGSTKKGTYSGVAGYLSWTFMPKMKISFRAESLNDKDGFRFANAAAIAGTTGTKHREVTATLAYLAADNLELRGEVRSDRADQAVYTDGANLSKSLTTFAVQGLYKF
jgi:hypothetical protein